MRAERIALISLPWTGLVLSGLFFHFLFPGFTDVQNWIFDGLEFLVFPLWFLTGGILGAALSVIWSRWPKKAASFARRGALVLFGYIGVAFVIALLTGEGEGLNRIGESAPIKVWGAAVWFLAATGPSLLGTMAVMRDSKWARAGSVVSYLLVASVLMIFSQARYAEVLFQEPLLSLLFIWSVVIFMESLNWRKRYLEYELTNLWLRQALFTVLFLGIGSVVVYIPTIFADDIMASYEGNTVLGKAVVGGLIILPLGIFAWVKGFVDSFRG